MSLILSTRDVATLGRLTQTLLSPLDFETVDAWRSAVNRLAKELLGADQATFRLPGSAVEFYTEDFGPEAFQGYPDRWRDKGYDVEAVRQNELRAVVWFRKTIHPVDPQRLYRTDYYSHCVAVRGFDSLGLTIEPLDDGKLAGFLFHHDRPKGPRFGSRGHHLLQLVLAAFRAGVQTYLRLATQQAQLGAALDLLSEGAVLLNADGRPVHSNAALSHLLANDPERSRLESALQALGAQLCRAVGGAGARGERLSQTVPASEVTTARARYRLRATLFGEGIAARSPTVLVALERVRAEPPRAEQLAARYQLTPSEGEVALLLVQRRTNAEIARALGISPHTARHHTESVFLKTGAHSRTHVADLLKHAPAAGNGASLVLPAH
ncbi:MAG TPA: helix-turn-helix transcriptional regulator [Gemmatimonadales bacterium]|nr:helix-turn-helix transcriptional regulator [Gemmatimonadales bacterium]